MLGRVILTAEMVVSTETADCISLIEPGNPKFSTYGPSDAVAVPPQAGYGFL
jgi:hypothetical protein